MATPNWLLARLSRPCTVYTRVESGKDEYGDITYSETAAQLTCFIQPAGQQEIQEGRAQIGAFMVTFPETAVGALDGFERLVVDGVSYEAVGPPAVFASLTRPGVNHVEAIVERSTA